MLNRFNWKHAVILGLLVCVLSVVAGATLAQDEPDAPEPAVPIFDLSGSAVEPSQEAQIEPAVVVIPAGEQATNLGPNGKVTSLVPPTYTWEADLTDTESLELVIYPGDVNSTGTVVADGFSMFNQNFPIDLTVDPQETGPCTGTTPGLCSFTDTGINLEDGSAYYWEVWSYDTPGTIPTLLYNDEVTTRRAILNTFEFDGTAGDIVTISVESAQFDTYVEVYGPGFVDYATNDDDPNITDATNSLIEDLTLTATGTYTINIYTNGTLGGASGDVFTLTLEEQGSAAGANHIQTLRGITTTVAYGGYIVDLPTLYPDYEDIQTTTPIITWPQDTDVEWYNVVTSVNGVDTYDNWFAAEDLTLDGEDYPGVCADDQCRVRPDVDVTDFGVGDTTVQLTINTYSDADGYIEDVIQTQFTVLAPITGEGEESFEFTNGIRTGRPALSVRDSDAVAEDWYGILRSSTPDYYRVYLFNDDTGETYDNWYYPAGGSIGARVANPTVVDQIDNDSILALYQSDDFTLYNGNYSYYVQGYDVETDGYTAWSGGRSFSIQEEAPSLNDMQLLGVYDAIGDTDSPYDPDPYELTATWTPCAVNTDGRPECENNRPWIHFRSSIESYSGDWLGVFITDQLTGEDVAGGWYNTRTGEKFENGVLHEWYDTTDSNWWCSTSFATGGVAEGFPFYSCIFQPLSLDWFLPNGFTYEISLASFGAGGLSVGGNGGFSIPLDPRNDPNGVGLFDIAPEAAPTGLAVDLIGAPLTGTWEDFPHFLTETLLDGVAKLSWDHAPSATWYNVTVSDPSNAVIFDEWLEVGDLFSYGSPLDNWTVDGLYCSIGTTSLPVPTPFTPDVDFDFSDTDSYFDSAYLSAAGSGNDEARFTFDGLVGEVFTIAADQNFDLDPSLLLIGPDGTGVASDDNSGGGVNALIDAFTLPQSGVYTIVVKNIGTDAGEVFVSVDQINRLFIENGYDDTNFFENIAAAGDVAGGDIVKWTVRGLAGQTLDPSAYESTFNGNLDLTISVKYPNGFVLASNGPAGIFGTASLIDVELPVDGAYIIEVQNSGVAGDSYYLAVSKNDPILPTPNISYDDGNGASLAGAGDTADIGTWDFVEYILEGGAGDVISLRTFSNGSGADLMVEIWDMDGNRLAVDYDSGEDATDIDTLGDAWIDNFTIPADGLYYIRVYNGSTSGGIYDLEVHLVSLSTTYYNGSCGYSLPAEYLLDPGDYTWTVTYYNGGISETATDTFTFDPPAPDAPDIADQTMNVYVDENLTGTTRAIFYWDHIQGNTWYYVDTTPAAFFAPEWQRASDICYYDWSDRGPDGEWYTDDDVYKLICDYATPNYYDTDDDVFVLEQLLEGGDYEWTVSAYSGDGAIDITDPPAQFTVNGAPTGEPAAVFPAASTDGTNIPSLTWTNWPDLYFTPGDNAAWYYVYVAPSDDLGTPALSDWYYLPEDNVDAGGTFPEGFENQHDDVCYTYHDFDQNPDLTYNNPLNNENFDATGGANDSRDYTFNGRQGYIVSIYADDNGAGTDPRIQLLDKNGSVIASDDNGGPGNDAYIYNFELPSTGIYTLRVTNLAAIAGDMTIEIESIYDTPEADWWDISIFTGIKQDGSDTDYIFPGEGNVVCSLYGDRFEENGVYQWWMLAFGPNGVPDTEYGGYTYMGEFEIDVPAAETAYTIFEPVNGVIPAGGMVEHTFYWSSNNENLSIDANIQGANPSVFLFAPGDSYGTSESLNTGFGVTTYMPWDGIYTIVLRNDSDTDATVYQLNLTRIDEDSYDPFVPAGNGVYLTDGTAVAGPLETLEWNVPYDNDLDGWAAFPLYYYVEVVDTATNAVIFAEWYAAEDICGDYYCEISDVSDVDFSPYGVYQIDVQTWGQGNLDKLIAGDPNFGASIQQDNPATDIDEGGNITFTKL